MRRKTISLITCSFILYLSFISSAFSASVNLWEIFPKSAQGENGVYAKAYNLNTNEFRDLINIGDYAFGTPGTPWNIPYISSPRNKEPWIITHPIGSEYSSQEMTILLLSSPYGQVFIDRIQGEVDPIDGGYIHFTIVGSNLMGPSVQLYQTEVGNYVVSFDIGPFSQPFQFLSFHVAPAGESYNDTTKYQATINFRPVPIPSTFLLFVSSLAILPFLRKRIFPK